jgi:hypothetical protein
LHIFKFIYDSLHFRELIEAEDWFGDEDEEDAPVLDSFEFDEHFQVKTLEEFVRMGVAFRYPYLYMLTYFHIYRYIYVYMYM